jgi:hypothetical protein
LRGFALAAGELVLRVSFGVVFENGAVGGAAARQIGGSDQRSARTLKLGYQRAPRIGRDRLDRASAWAEREPVQRQCSRSRIARH